MYECERLQQRITRLASGISIIRVGASSEVELIEKKQLASFKIKCLVLKYPPEMCKLVKDMDFQQELDFIVTNESVAPGIAPLINIIPASTSILITSRF